MIITPHRGWTPTPGIVFTIRVAEPVSGLTIDDFQLSNGQKLSFQNSGAVYFLAVNALQPRRVTCRLPFGLVQTSIGLLNDASNPSVVEYQLPLIPEDEPTLEISLEPGPWARLTLLGIVGMTYANEHTAALGATASWPIATIITLAEATQNWTDPGPATTAKRLYRAKMMP